MLNGIIRYFIYIFCHNPLIFKDRYCWKRKNTAYQIVIIYLLREEMNLSIKMDPECPLENLLYLKTKTRKETQPNSSRVGALEVE